MNGDLQITGDPEADDLLNTNPLALVIGMLLDQQVPMSWAFRGPATLAERMGGLEVETIAAMDVEEFVAVCVAKPAIHRYPAAMGRRIHALCQSVIGDYQGDVEAIWREVDDADALAARLSELPGFGDEKVKIFVALLAKRFGVEPSGWERVAGPFADRSPRSAADVADADSLARVREWKRDQRAAGKSKQE